MCECMQGDKCSMIINNQTNYSPDTGVHVYKDTNGWILIKSTCTCTVEPLNKGHVGDQTFCPL